MARPAQPDLDAATERLWTEIEGRREELIHTVAELVRRPSLLGQEAAAQSYVAEHLRASGLETEVWDLDEDVKRLPNAGKVGCHSPAGQTWRVSVPARGRSLAHLERAH